MIGMKGRRSHQPTVDATTRSLVFQVSAVLLGYPDDPAAIALVDTAVPNQIDTGPLHRIRGFLDWWLEQEPMQRETCYVDTFEHRRRCSLDLTYFADGDTRRRGESLLEIADEYRRLGVTGPVDELPDYLPALLELAATVSGGDEVLITHQGSIEFLRRSLTALGSPFAEVLAAVTDVLPPITAGRDRAINRLMQEGPPTEEVGLDVAVADPVRRGGGG